MKDSADVVILTPMPLEGKEVCAFLTDARTIFNASGIAATLGSVPGVPWPVAVVVTGEGPDYAGAIARSAAEWLRPRALFVVGVAGALKNDVKLGDVVVANWVHDFRGGKETRTGPRARPRGWPANLLLEQVAKITDLSGAGAAALPAGTRIHFKPIASGNTVLSTRTGPLAELLDQSYNDAVAIEMESAGVAAAASLGQVPPVLVIRGISDNADEAKPLRDASGSQPVAAANAAAFAAAVLRQLPAALAAASGEAVDRQPDPAGLRWRPLDQPLPAVWPADLGLPKPRAFSTVEVCLLPAGLPRSLGTGRLAALPAELASLGRAGGVFAPDADVTETGGPAAVAAAGRRAGLAVTRAGVRCGWQKLPQDSYGSVLDQQDLETQLAALLVALTAADVPPPPEAGFAVAVTPGLPLSEGRAAGIPRSTRNRTSMMRPEVPAAEVLTWPQITGGVADVAAELSARLVEAFRSRAGGPVLRG